MTSHNNNTTRFSNRVDDYVKYRPGYPAAMLRFLQENYNLDSTKIIADIGSGTGISSAYFLEAGYQVMGVEPNPEMREKSVELLQHFPLFKAVDGTAETTTLNSDSVDVIISGQAFHWFDVVKAKEEFKRILRPDSLLILFWNERLQSSDFEKEYDALIVKHAIDYVKVDHRRIDWDSIETFYTPHQVELKEFPNYQVFDFEGLKGRLLSSSYMPQKGDKGYDAMVADLKQLYDKYQQHDSITINYATKIYIGKLT
ncbi:class I SAM-dependent methyltransferase [Taibaiella lutea]|nr:class I SAM-dependent methyltransferase [Taibaiella lutea]